MKSNHIGNHATMEFEQLVTSVKLTGRSLDYTMMKTQIFNEELRDIVFAVSALALEDDE
ncbi:MAG: hypothetical protein IIA19_03115 [Thaumarchaeota archaeon]|nr:hypothetical protein [Nitrososphaerota archaeon]